VRYANGKKLAIYKKTIFKFLSGIYMRVTESSDQNEKARIF
jgi:hypothetical protein